MTDALARKLDLGALRRAASMIKVLGHPERLAIVEALAGGAELTVSEICRSCGMRQPICSQHLGRLRESRLVGARRDGAYVRYRVIEPGAHAIVECIHRCFAKR